MKTANFIVIGGTIAVGKSTLVEGISKAKGWNVVPELNDDVLQDLVLKQQYEHERLHNIVIEYYFLTSRFIKYRKYANSLVTSIFDRGIFESIIFTTMLMAKEQPRHFKAFKKFWYSTIEKLITNYGIPKLYIYLKVDWENFKKRVYSRNREVEVVNFDANKSYFKGLLSYYNNHFKEIIAEFNIPLVEIDTTTLSQEEVLEVALTKLNAL